MAYAHYVETFSSFFDVCYGSPSPLRIREESPEYKFQVLFRQAITVRKVEKKPCSLQDERIFVNSIRKSIALFHFLQDCGNALIRPKINFQTSGWRRARKWRSLFPVITMRYAGHTLICLGLCRIQEGKKQK